MVVNDRQTRATRTRVGQGGFRALTVWGSGVLVSYQERIVGKRGTPQHSSIQVRNSRHLRNWYLLGRWGILKRMIDICLVGVPDARQICTYVNKATNSKN